jgi:hypothetical protein
MAEYEFFFTPDGNRWGAGLSIQEPCCRNASSRSEKFVSAIE